MPPFDNREYRQRIERTKQRMTSAGIDVLIVSHPANLNYLSGYDGWSYYVHQAAVLSMDAGEPIWFGRAMDVPGAQATVWMGSDHIRSYPDEYVDSSERHPMHALSALVLDQGWGATHIGVEMDAWYFTAAAYQILTQQLPDATFVNAWPLVNWVRIKKSAREIELMRGAGEIVTRAMQVAIESINPGVRENDAVANITYAQIAGTPEFWGDYPASLASVPSGAKSAAPHLTWTGDPFKKGSATNIELGGCHHRYHAALARTLFLGKPPKKLKDLAAATTDGLMATLETVRSGNVCEQVEAAWRTVINKAGYAKPSRIGYSIGLNYPPDWGEQTASLRPGDRTVLECNMCFHLMLGMWMDNWGFELSETVRVTDSAPELLTNFEQRLFVKD